MRASSESNRRGIGGHAVGRYKCEEVAGKRATSSLEIWLRGREGDVGDGVGRHRGVRLNADVVFTSPTALAPFRKPGISVGIDFADVLKVA